MAKRAAEEADARGWDFIGKTVCSECVVDYALKQAVLDVGDNDVCDYCGTTPKPPESSAPVETVLSLVVDGLNFELEDPVVGVMYSTADGGYQMRTRETWDLVFELEISEDEQLLKDIICAIHQQLWVQRDPYAASPEQALVWGWEQFREFVKHQRRYTFLSRDDSTADGGGMIPMHGMPAAIADAIKDARRTAVIPAGAEWWRVRVHAPGERYVQAKEIGTPPNRHARDNRMTPKGIGAFYGASTAAGARAEVAGYASSSDDGSIGKFVTTRPLNVVDLRDAPDLPSLFEVSERHRRASILFIRGFLDDVRKISDPSDIQNLDYVPTQVIAEYLRYELSDSSGPVEGILWKSSKDPAVDDCVLFVDADAVGDGIAGGRFTLVLDATSVSLIGAPL